MCLFYIFFPYIFLFYIYIFTFFFLDRFILNFLSEVLGILGWDHCYHYSPALVACRLCLFLAFVNRVYVLCRCIFGGVNVNVNISPSRVLCITIPAVLPLVILVERACIRRPDWAELCWRPKSSRVAVAGFSGTFLASHRPLSSSSSPVVFSFVFDCIFCCMRAFNHHRTSSSAR